MKLKAPEQYFDKWINADIPIMAFIGMIWSDAYSDITELRQEIEMLKQIQKSNRQLNDRQMWMADHTKTCTCKREEQLSQTWCCNTCGRPTPVGDPCPWWVKLNPGDKFVDKDKNVHVFDIHFLRTNENKVYWAPLCSPYTATTLETILSKLTDEERSVIEQAIKEGNL